MKKRKKRTEKVKVINKETGMIAVEKHELELTKGPKSVALDIQTLFMNAITGKLPPDQMEKLLAMRRELMAENARKQYFIALTKFQNECPQIEKTISVKNKDGNSVRYKFPPIEHVREKIQPSLDRNGFSISFNTEQNPKELTSICIAHHRDGHSEQTSFTVPIDKDAYMNDMQKVAAAASYADRYSLKRLMGIVFRDEDNDANGVDKKIPHPTPDWTQSKPAQVAKSKLDPKKEVKQPGEISEDEKCKAYADRIRALALAECNNDKNIAKEWLLKETEKLMKIMLPGTIIPVLSRSHARIATMSNLEIIRTWEAIKDRVIKFETETQNK